MGLTGRSTVAVLTAALLLHAQGGTPSLAAADSIVEPLSCLQPVNGFTWLRWDDNRPSLDLSCRSLGRPLLRTGEAPTGHIRGMRILSWNVHVGAGRLDDLLPRLLEEASRDGVGLTILLQETFRTGDAVPGSYPATLRVPRAIRPRRPT